MAAETPLTKADLRHLLQEIKMNMATEFSRHLAPITDSLNDLTRRTTAIEDQLDRTSMRSQTNETAIPALQDQPQNSRNAWAFRPLTSPPSNLTDAQQEGLLPGAQHRTRLELQLPAALNRPPKDDQMTTPWTTTSNTTLTHTSPPGQRKTHLTDYRTHGLERQETMNCLTTCRPEPDKI
ncbi:Hypothetical predicted protein [Pelobates cultripes]|uniref:Uncharacterized protein n=1 Tax=Pelobates cultripes TaxID=61616 RepID=A0AAD1SU15_PELCU|nr:Hypothetical predicted protein [Pelobates cultripes]